MAQLLDSLGLSAFRQGRTARRPAGDRAVLPSGRGTFQRDLTIGLVVVVLGTAFLAMLSIAPSVDRFRSARRSFCDLRQFSATLDASATVSAERGPANILMALGPVSRGDLTERLTAFRQRTDRMLEGLVSPHVAGEGCVPEPVPGEIVAKARDQLAVARSRVDRVIATPPGGLTAESFQDAIAAMFQASDLVEEATVWSANRIVGRNPDLSAPTMIGHMLSDLRDFGGRSASDIIPAIAVGQPITPAGIAATRASQGRLNELWHLVRSQTDFYDEPFFVQGRAAIGARFFGEGFAILDRLIADSRAGGPYSMGVQELTDRFVPTMRPIEDYRAAFLDRILRKSEANRTAALRTLLLASLSSASIALMLGAILLTLRRHVFRPLLQAHEDVLRLAEDLQPRHRESTGRPPEIRALFEAIGVLQAKVQERALLARELRVQAETDSLTGLYNRRTFERLVVSAPSDEVCLILMDIDRFKAVNDTHGHATGDRVLVQIATLLRSCLRSDDVIARLGGEEFAILIAGGETVRGVGTAEKIRFVVNDATFTTTDGQRLRVSASFGVASGRRGAPSWPGLLEAADAALYCAKRDGRDRVRCAGI